MGHFLPLGSRGALHGVSLLQREGQKPLWSTSPPSLAYDVDEVYVGPSGPTFCVFQSHRRLFVVDPGTGAILWQRTDLDPQSGLFGEPVHGIFGDEEVIVVLASDRLGYTLYQTSTGKEIRQGRLDNESRQTQERRTFSVVASFTPRQMKRTIACGIWDPLGDRVLYERALSDRVPWRKQGTMKLR